MNRGQRKRLRETAMTRLRAVEAVLRRWDPIAVRPGELAPAGEYDGYAPHIVAMVVGGCSVAELAAHLEKLRREVLGVEQHREHDLDIAREIVASLRRAGS